jgi:hypothetical protein
VHARGAGGAGPDTQLGTGWQAEGQCLVIGQLRRELDILRMLPIGNNTNHH